MSMNKIFIGSLIATSFGIAGLATTAEAQSSRYGSGTGFGNVYDYESGSCGDRCATPVNTQSSRYGSTVQHPVYSGAIQQGSVYQQRAPVYVDCRATGTCAPQPTTVYTQPAQTYSAPIQSSYSAPVQSYQTQSFQTTQAPAQCPSGTTPQSDGTCLQSGSVSSFSTPSTSFGSSSSYSSSSYSAPSTSLPAECPAGTTPSSDGTCLQSGSSFSSFDSGSSFSDSSSFSSSSSSYGSGSSFGGTPTNCPAGTTAQSDGTCMQGGSSSFGSGSEYSNAYSGGNVELFTGDATTSPPSYGYGSGGSYGATDYLPIRK